MVCPLHSAINETTRVQPRPVMESQGADWILASAPNKYILKTYSNVSATTFEQPSFPFQPHPVHRTILIRFFVFCEVREQWEYAGNNNSGSVLTGAASDMFSIVGFPPPSRTLLKSLSSQIFLQTIFKRREEASAWRQMRSHG